MKRLIAIILMFFLVVPPVQAAGTDLLTPEKFRTKKVLHGRFYLGEETQRGGWVQGISTTSDTIYFWDGSQLKAGKNGVATVYFDLKDIAEQLSPYKLNNNSSYFSFILSAIERKGNDLYVSGLMFRDAQKDRRKIGNKDVIGETYTVLFKIPSERKGELLHISLSKEHTGKRTVGVWDNATGMPNGDPSRYEEPLFDAIVHFENITPAKFSFNGNNIIMTRHRKDHNGFEWADIIELDVNGNEQILYTFDVDEGRTTYHYVYGVRKGNELSVYDDYGVAEKNLTSGSVEYQKLSNTKLLTRPQQRDGEMFFLDEIGLFTLYKGSADGLYHMRYILKADQIYRQPHIEITSYDWNTSKGILYLSDWLRQRDFWTLKPVF